MDAELKSWLDELDKHDGEGIRQSNMFMAVFSPDMIKDPRCAFQIGLAILLEKPIGLIVIKGATVPPALTKIAKAIEVVKDADNKEEFNNSAKRLLDNMKAGL